MAALGRPAVLVWTAGGLPVARRVAAALGDADVHGRTEGVDVAVAGPWADHLVRLFADGRPVIGLCAAGILVRTLAPCLRGKEADPPVIAVAEDGSAVVPLLGGHHGGNRLARTIAEALGVAAAITTASDLHLGVALDDPPPGLVLANPGDHKAFAAAALDGAAIRVEGEAAWLGLDPQALGGEDSPLTIEITSACVEGGARRLVYHPKRLAVGVGCERDAPEADVTAFVRETLAGAGLAEAAVAGVFSVDLKADEPAVHACAAALGAPARFFDAAVLEALTPRLANPSEVVFREVSAHGVAEAAALAAAGPEARLVVEKRKGRRATCAVAAAPAPFNGAGRGRPQGRLMVVGLGPGDPRWRTPEADTMLREADDIVGYRGYLDQLADLPGNSKRHGFDLGEEEARVRHALDLAAAGRAVALVSSGDAGIYAMAALVHEVLDREPRPEWQRIALATAPGISALQAAAARVGAPLGHDFCAISLSDLLTSWQAIERRLRAAAEGDFVVALYNPVSRRRREQLVRAREILRTHRPADTPVVLARQLGRDGETIEVVGLDALEPALVDMLTLVLIGSSQTRLSGTGRLRRVYTPRGYANKRVRAS